LQFIEINEGIKGYDTGLFFISLRAKGMKGLECKCSKVWHLMSFLNFAEVSRYSFHRITVWVGRDL